MANFIKEATICSINNCDITVIPNNMLIMQFVLKAQHYITVLWLSQILNFVVYYFAYNYITANTT